MAGWIISRPVLSESDGRTVPDGVQLESQGAEEPKVGGDNRGWIGGLLSAFAHGRSVDRREWEVHQTLALSLRFSRCLIVRASGGHGHGNHVTGWVGLRAIGGDACGSYACAMV